jgi:hypothetical protein
MAASLTACLQRRLQRRKSRNEYNGNAAVSQFGYEKKPRRSPT